MAIFQINITDKILDSTLADPDTATSHIIWCPEVVEKTKPVNQLKRERITFSRQQLQSLEDLLSKAA